MGYNPAALHRVGKKKVQGQLSKTLYILHKKRGGNACTSWELVQNQSFTFEGEHPKLHIDGLLLLLLSNLIPSP